MRALILEKQNVAPIVKDVAMPTPAEGQVLLEVHACGICRTDLHIRDGELKEPKLPLIMGHQIVGTVKEVGHRVDPALMGTRRGVPWLGRTCGTCEFCQSGKENLCDSPLFTGYNLDGGFAEYTLAYADFTLPLPEDKETIEIAPLLCAGLIGYRAYRMAGEAQKIGLYGFGSAAHLVTQIAVHQGRQIFVFTREGDFEGQVFAKSLGAVFAGSSKRQSPVKLDAALIFAPDGKLIPKALRDLKKGAPCISAGIHMSDIPSFPYQDLWEERSIHSVANLTRQDGIELLQVLKEAPIHPQVTVYPLERGAQALDDLKAGNLQGSAVIVN
jgi:propanol-preferring alcohol dehydrogenase